MANKKLTEQDVLDSYEFNLACYLIQKEFPWIKDCVVDSEAFANERFKTVIWMDFIVDPFEIMETYGWKLEDFVPVVYYDNNQKYRASLSAMFDIPFETGNTIVKKIGTILIETKDTKILPDDLKLPADRFVTAGSFIIPPGFEL